MSGTFAGTGGVQAAREGHTATWLMLYKGRELVILSRPFKTKELSEKARLKYPDRVHRKIGISVVRVSNS